jgi:phosphoserine phosphatase RsbU/P
LLGRLLAVERDTVGAAQELAARYEEIDLLYTISDILGRTIGLEEAAEVIVREVSSVVGSRRASIFVHDADEDMLRPVAGWGLDVGEFGPISVDHPQSVSARVFRENVAVAGDASDLQPPTDLTERRQAYRGSAFLCAPITYPDPHGVSRPVGVINLTDRLGTDSFSSGDRKLVAAIAHQIGAAIENARLVELDRQRERVRRDLELAHDLQLGLLPPPNILGSDVDLFARCSPGELVGGDFYQLVPLAGSQIGVMLGDVSTHGFPAALIMALVLSAAGIHAAASRSPQQALDRLLASVRAELTKTEMFLSLFYAVIDRRQGRIRYANAGHPHAFLLPLGGDPIRLHATAPPLGLSDASRMKGSRAPFKAGDLLIVFSDGLVDARDAAGTRWGEDSVLSVVRAHDQAPTQAIVEAVFAEFTEFADSALDDQTLLVLRR